MENRRHSGQWEQHNTQAGFYEPQQSTQSGPYKYYEPPARAQGRSSFSERAGGGQPTAYQPKGGQPTLRIDPDAPPANLRSEPWSPELSSPQSVSLDRQQRDPTNSGGASGMMRKGSVPDRSPLQKLEMQASKEQKRARAEDAEWRARQKSSGQTLMPSSGDARAQERRSNDTRRVVSDGARRPEDSGRRQEQSRSYAAEDTAAPQAENGGQRFRRASEALRKETSPDLDHYAPKPKQAATTMESRPKQAATTTESRPYHYATPATRETDTAQQQPSRPERQDQSSNTVELGRTPSGKYKHRARDAGFAGAAAAMAGGTAAERGKMAYERRKGQAQQSPQPSPTVSSPRYYGAGGSGGDADQSVKSPQSEPLSPARQESGHRRSNSKKLQKRRPPPAEWNGRDRSDSQGSDDQQPMDEPHIGRQSLQTDRMGGGGKKDIKAAMAFQDPDPLPPSRVTAENNNGVKYRIPPQTAGGQAAKERVGLGTENATPPPVQQDKHHRLGGMFHHHDEEHRSYQPSSRPLDEWRNAGIAKLTLDDLQFEGYNATGAADQKGSAPWWEKGGRRTSSGGSANTASAQYDGAYEEPAQHFRPELFVKCGPLLRYTGMRKEAAQASRSGRVTSGEREIWRGSVMIVTDDRQSDLSCVPTLRIFAQPMDLHIPPPRHLLESGQELPPEYEDPVAGQVKLSRTGRPLYVRPVHDIDGGVDLSRVENPQGLYAPTRTPMLGPQSISGPDGRQSQHITFQDKSRIKRHSGEKAGRVREVKAHRLHVERECTFWRFNLEIELGSTQHRVAYRINKGPAIGFWVPARGETMNMMFHSCNGFSMAVNPDLFSGPDPLWRDVLNQHQSRPFHLMIGGGDQIYNDAATRDTIHFKEWLATKNPEHKHKADFTPELQDELETFYLERYAMWFSQGLFAMANSQIPMVNIWDDHDIMDGFGSYPHHFMSSRVFTGLGAVAYKYYMLFQHQSVASETERDEPSWLMGASPGPYINERSRSVFMSLGKKVKLLGLDCRTERMRDEVLSQETYDIVFDRCRAEIVEDETRHLIVLLGVPIAYPRLNFLENILTSKVMDPIKALGRTGMLGGFVNKFDGGVEILDDLDDHWTAKHHKAERNWFIQELQELAAEKSVRITILGGDVHLGAVGQFYTPKKFGVAKDRDHRYMPNVVSSAIVNTPPPTAMADILNRRNKVHHLDEETDEDLIPMFDTDVDGKARNNKTLLPRRNYCTIREFVPSDTPPSSPRQEHGAEASGNDERNGRGGKQYPPGSMKRTMSLTRGPMGLVRRWSGSGKSKNHPASPAPDRDERPYSSQSQGPGGMQRSGSMGGGDTGSYFPPVGNTDGAPQRPTNQFQRRVTSLSVKEAKKAASKGGADSGRVNLEGGLDISLNMEVDQRDPSGATVPYRLLVPALWYEGEGDLNPADNKDKAHSGGLMGMFKGRGKHNQRDMEGGEYAESPTFTPPSSRHQTMPPQQGTFPIRGASHDGYQHHGPPQLPRDQMDGHDEPSNRHSSSNGYKKGYDLSSPPVGSAHHPSRNTTQGHYHPYPNTENYRQGGKETAYSSEGSLTPSAVEEYDEKANGNVQKPAVRARRPSKAERFFGIGDEGGMWGGDGGNKRHSVQDSESYGEPGGTKRKPLWMIWKQ